VNFIIPIDFYRWVIGLVDHESRNLMLFNTVRIRYPLAHAARLQKTHNFNVPAATSRPVELGHSLLNETLKSIDSPQFFKLVEIARRP